MYASEAEMYEDRIRAQREESVCLNFWMLPSDTSTAHLTITAQELINRMRAIGLVVASHCLPSYCLGKVRRMVRFGYS